MIWKVGDFVQVELWKNFIKRKNSTKIPANAGQTLEVALKDATSIENPTFILSGNEFEYNYIKALGHYYFVRDLRSVRHNVIEVDCVQDVLATYKSDILAYTCFVERSESNYDKMFIDELVSVKQEPKNITFTTTQLPFIDNVLGKGCYILRMVGNDGTGVSTYVSDSLSTFTVLFDQSNYLEGTSEWYDKLGNLLFNPFDYVVSLCYSPLDIKEYRNYGGAVLQDVYAKWYPLGIQAYRVVNQSDQRFIEINIPVSEYDDFRKYVNNFSYYSIYLPGVGKVDLSNSDIKGTLTCYYSIDLWTGYTSVTLMTGEELSIVSNYTANIYSPIQIGNDSSNLSNYLQTGVQGATQAMSFYNKRVNKVDVASNNVISMINTVSNFVHPTPSSSGQSGNSQMFNTPTNKISVILYTYESGDIPIKVAGRPCNKNLLLGTLSGFTKCGNASCPINGFSVDKDEVNAYLNSGFYIE